jgi:hypothetical protein
VGNRTAGRDLHGVRSRRRSRVEGPGLPGHPWRGNACFLSVLGEPVIRVCRAVKVNIGRWGNRLEWRGEERKINEKDDQQEKN